jgi:hypothetical protein
MDEREKGKRKRGGGGGGLGKWAAYPSTVYETVVVVVDVVVFFRCFHRHGKKPKSPLGSPDVG